MTAGTSRFVRYESGIEIEQPGEADDIAAVRASAKIRQFTLDEHRHALRDAHAKSHGILHAEVHVRRNLAPELAQGVFATPQPYAAIIRLSTVPGECRPRRCRRSSWPGPQAPWRVR
jgi:hypothetical protein